MPFDTSPTRYVLETCRRVVQLWPHVMMSFPSIIHAAICHDNRTSWNLGMQEQSLPEDSTIYVNPQRAAKVGLGVPRGLLMITFRIFRVFGCTLQNLHH